jgi:hypothetical protein
MKEIRLLTLLLVATLFVQNATAGLILPYSSHYQGRSYFPESITGVKGFVDFAVYDTQGLYGDEWGGNGFEAPGTGRFIYAYQVFSDANSTAAIDFFTIMGIDDPPTPHHLIGIDTINSQNPWELSQLITEGVAPTSTETNLSETRGTWKFAGSIFAPGEYSWFLIFSSDNDWVQGKYTMETSSIFPVASNPEPCTLALLGLGSAILFAKRRNSVAIKSRRTRLHN